MRKSSLLEMHELAKVGTGKDEVHPSTKLILLTPLLSYSAINDDKHWDTAGLLWL